jgi:hypothetical protein
MSGLERHLRRARERQQKPIAPGLIVYDRATPYTDEQMVRAAARVEGCTCDPDVDLSNPPHAHISHDDWCALLRAHEVN